MPRKISELSKLEIGRIRSNLSRKASVIGDRLIKNTLGELKDKNGDPVEMTNSQVQSAKIVLGHILPAMQSTEITEHVEKVTKEQVEGNLQAEIQKAIQGMTEAERQALIESVEASKQ